MALCWPVQVSMTAKAVLMSLADQASDEGHCWPSMSTVAERTCMSRRTVLRGIEELEKSGHVVIDRTFGRASKYQIVPEPVTVGHTSVGTNRKEKPSKVTHSLCQPVTGDTESHVTESHTGCDRESQGVCHTVTGGVTESHTNRKEPSLNRKGTVSTRATRIPDGWKPSPADEKFALDRGIPVGLEAEKFRNHWTGASKNATSPDWGAKWRTWVLNAVSWSAQRSPAKQAPADRRAATVAAFVAQGEPHEID